MNYKQFMKFELMCVIFAVVFCIMEALQFSYWYEAFVWLLPMYTISTYKIGKPGYISIIGTITLCFIARVFGLTNIIAESVTAEYANLGFPIFEQMTGIITQLFVVIYCVTNNFGSAYKIYKKLVSAKTYEDVRVNSFYRIQESIRLLNSITSLIGIFLLHWFYHIGKMSQTVIYALIIIVASTAYSYVVEDARTKRTREILNELNKECCDDTERGDL